VGAVAEAVGVVVFFVVGFLDFPVCLVVGPAVCFAVSVAAAVDFVAFFFYPFFQGCANLYDLPHPQIVAQLPAVLMK
jgi:hypothetical protein